MAGEGLLAQIFSLADFPVTVGKPAAGQADGQVRVRAQDMTDAQLGVHVNRRDGQSQSQIGLDEPRLVVIVKRVTGERAASLQRLIVTELEEPPFFRVELRARRPRSAQTSKKHEPGPVRWPLHAVVVT